MVATVAQCEPGGYRFIEGVFQYSAGVAAEPGYAIVRARFRGPAPLAEGFAKIERHLTDRDRPLSAFCACELRSPEPLGDDGFRQFNRAYVGVLERWGIAEGERNPVARTNVCPAYDPPGETSIHAFSYTVPVAGSQAGGFVISGSGEAREGGARYQESVVCPGDTSPEGMQEKARFVMGEMEARLAALGFDWRDALSTQVYTVHEFCSFAGAEIAARGAARGGIEWHISRPPVLGLDFEMDVRGVLSEFVIDA